VCVCFAQLCCYAQSFHGIVEIAARRGAIYRALDNDCANDNTGAMLNQGAINQGAINQGAINRAPTIVGGFADENNPMLHNNFSRLIRWIKGWATFECRKNARMGMKNHFVLLGKSAYKKC
jgi:hypothetical protein